MGQNSIWFTFLFLLQYLKREGDPGERRIYKTIELDLTWPHMDKNICRPFRECHERARIQAGLKRKGHVNLLSATRSLQFVAMNTFAPLLKPGTGSHLIVLKTDW